MNLAYVSGLRFAPTDQDYEWRDSLLYALALGFGRDPLHRGELPYVYEAVPGRPQRVVPSMAVILGWQPFWHDDPAAAIDWKRIVHGEAHLQLHAPLPAAGRVCTRHRLVRVRDKGAGRGAVLQIDTELFERERGTHLATLQSLQFLRGDGGCGDWGDPAAAAPVLPALDEDAVPIACVDLPTPQHAALLYRIASRDWMPIHADPAIARQAGFERPISHGLNNLGIACRALLTTLGLDRPERLRSLAARFVAPGLPGDTVRVEIFRRDALTLQFRASAMERGVCVLDRGLAQLHD
ncbi:MAG: MaoC family dehydratase N-terminal domain-containing protein [Rubrivivax sp.]|nr:MaoC family dehydratase N-terminal domain-containing protein [Rubrivivax sp.]